MIIDLHMHSNVSDGKLSPADLVRLVHANGVELMALTDHDTMDGVRQASSTMTERRMAPKLPKRILAVSASTGAPVSCMPMAVTDSAPIFAMKK